MGKGRGALGCRRPGGLVLEWRQAWEQPDRHRHKDGQAKAKRQRRLAQAQGLLGGAYDSGEKPKVSAGGAGYLGP